MQDSRWLRIREKEGIYAGQQVAENKREGGDLCNMCNTVGKPGLWEGLEGTKQNNANTQIIPAQQTDALDTPPGSTGLCCCSTGSKVSSSSSVGCSCFPITN